MDNEFIALTLRTMQANLRPPFAYRNVCGGIRELMLFPSFLGAMFVSSFYFAQMCQFKFKSEDITPFIALISMELAFSFNRCIFCSRLQ